MPPNGPDRPPGDPAARWMYELARAAAGAGLAGAPAGPPEPAWELRTERVTPANVREACALAVRRRQRRYVAPVARSLAEAYAEPEHAWPRLVYAGPRLVAFVMGGFVPGHPLMECTIWRLAVAADAQSRGCGRFAVRAVAEEAARRGHAVLTTAYRRGRGSPEGFYRRLGFRPTGRTRRDLVEAAAGVAELGAGQV